MYSRCGFSLFAITVEAGLYIEHSRDIGRQFSIRFLSLPPLGKHVITDYLNETVSFPFL